MSCRRSSGRSGVLPPLKWGKHRNLRCVNGEQVPRIDGQSLSSRSELQNRTLSKDSGSTSEKGDFPSAMAALQEKIISNLETVAKIEEAVLRKEKMAAEEEAKRKNDSSQTEQSPAAVEEEVGEKKDEGVEAFPSPAMAVSTAVASPRNPMPKTLDKIMEVVLMEKDEVVEKEADGKKDRPETEESPAEAEKKGGEKKNDNVEMAGSSAQLALPWNLRPRTVRCDGGNDGGIEEREHVKKAGETNGDGDGDGGWKAKRKPETTTVKLEVALSKKEIEEDFLKMVGRRPRRRPKKRRRIVQMEIDTLFPGSCLSKISADLYDVSYD